MLPSSDDLEELYLEAKRLSQTLGRIGSAEVKKQEIKDEAAMLCRAWLRVSPSIREAGCCKADTLDLFDSSMSELLGSTTKRARASALKSKLQPFLDDMVDAVIVPIIQVEGSPRHVAARQVQEVFEDITSVDESAYIEEAARCVTVECYRAALIMLWAAAVARIHAAVMKCGFDKYNSVVDSMAARKGSPFNRVKSGAKINSLPELQRSRDADILIIGMDLFEYDLQCYQELDRLLGQRNDCAHPGMNQPGALDVQQFATKLRSYVFDRVSVR
ncbi:MAG: hypothetical protein AAGB04_31445 [Pseudomonadota bacterium]